MAPFRIASSTLSAIVVLAATSVAMAETIAEPAATNGDAAAAPSEPEINRLRGRVDDHVFTVLVEPGKPQLGRRVLLRLDLATVPTTPDPTFGDRVPVRDATLVAVLTAPGTGDVHRQVLHPMAGAGSYGLHWTPDRQGLWRMTVERLGAELPGNSFQIGVGVSTPEQDDPALDRGPGGPTRILGGLERAQRGGGMVGPLTPVAAGPTAKTVMTAFAEPSGLLTAGLAASDPAAASDALGNLIRETRRLAGTTPAPHRGSSEEYDAMAADLLRRLESIAAAVADEDMGKARHDWRQTLDDTCAKCHTKYWWALTNDLSSWPQVRAQPRTR